MAEQEPKKDGPKDGAAKARPAVKWEDVDSFFDRIDPSGAWKKIFGPFLQQFVKNEPPPQTAEQKAAQAKADEGAQKDWETAFSDKEGLDKEKFSAEVSKFLHEMEEKKVLVFDSPAAKREFMNDVANAPYGRDVKEGKVVEAVAKAAVQKAKDYGVQVNLDKLKTNPTAVPHSFEQGRDVQLTSQQFSDITSGKNGGQINKYDVVEGHMVLAGSVSSEEIKKSFDGKPVSIAMLNDKGPAANTEGLVGHDDAPSASFFKLEGNGHVYYTDKQSLPGLGKDIWAKMEAAPDMGPSAKVPSPGMTQAVESRNYAAPSVSAGIG